MKEITYNLVGKKPSSFADRQTGQLVINNHVFVTVSGIEDEELEGIQCVDYSTKIDISTVKLGKVLLSFVPRGKTMSLCGIVNI